MDRKGGQAEVRRVIHHYKEEVRKAEWLDLKEWLLDFTVDALKGIMDDWVRARILKMGQESLLSRGIARLEK